MALWHLEEPDRQSSGNYVGSSIVVREPGGMWGRNEEWQFALPYFQLIDPNICAQMPGY